MGLLARMPWMQQGWGYGYFGGPTPQPQTQAQPQPQPAARPIQAPQASPLEALTPANQTPLSAMNTTMPQANPQTFSEQLQGLYDSPLLNIGLSLLGNAQNGGNWGGVAQDMQGFRNTQLQRTRASNEDRRLAVQDRREGAAWDRQQVDWNNADQAREHWQQAINAETDPQRQAMLRAIGPAGYGQFMVAETDRRFQAEQAALDRQNSLNVAGMRLTGANRPPDAGRYWVRPTGRDDMLMQDYEGSLQNARTALRGLDRLERLFGEMIQRDAQGRPLEASTRMTMNRLMQINPEARAAYEQIQSQVWPMVLQNLEGLAPVTEVELGQALARTVNADMTPEAAMAEIARMREEAQYAQDLSLRAFEFANEAGSIGRGRTDGGQNWAEFSGGIQRPEITTRNEQAARAPQRGETRVVNGATWRYVGGDPSQQGSWVRVQAVPDPARQPGGYRGR